MGYKTIDNFNLKGKRVLLRVDINSPVFNGKVFLSNRIKVAVRTIAELKKRKVRVVVIAHQGRLGDSDFTSLKQHANLISKFTKIKFVNDIMGEKAISEIKKLKNGEAILLENVRFLKEEFEPSKNKLVVRFSKLFDFYINDAFSVCHRDQTSVTRFPKFIKALAGPNLIKEVEALKKIRIKRALFILGGSKAEENILLMEGKVLTCGIFGQLCHIAKGFNFGSQNKFLKTKFSILPELKKKIDEIGKNIKMPLDFALKIKGMRVEIPLEKFPSNYEIYDVGERTVKIYEKEIKQAKFILMKGTAGYAEEKIFQKGTRKILKAIANSGAFSILAGGHLSEALSKLGISESKFNYVSLSGGALVAYLSGKKLPGLEALKK